MNKDYGYVFEVFLTFDKNKISEEEVEKFVEENFQAPIKVVKLQGHNLELEWPTLKTEVFPIQSKMHSILKQTKLATYYLDIKDCDTYFEAVLPENITMSRKKLKEIFANKSLNWREKEDYFYKSGREQLGETTYDYLNDEDFSQMMSECCRRMTDTEVKEFEEIQEKHFDFDEKQGKIIGFSNSGLESFDGFLEIPESINGVAVKVIGKSAFTNTGVTILILPASVINIEFAAFAHNYLTDLSIPKKVEVIGDFAFTDNELKTVKISKNIKKLGHEVFSDNSENLVIIKY